MKPRISPGFLKGFLSRLSGRKAPVRRRNVLRRNERVPELFKRNISTKSHRKAWEGLASRSGPPDSLFMWPLVAGADRIFGKERVHRALWKYMHAPATIADMAAGGVARKIPLLGEKLFKTKEQIPWGKGTLKEIDRSSALAPIVKLRDIAAPIIIGVGLEKGLETLVRSTKRDDKQEAAEDMRPELREKVASTMLHLHQENKGHRKRAQALRVMYKQAELGLDEVPRTFGELEEKLASLMNQDLVVLEKALELHGGSIKLGELGEVDSVSHDATEQFRAAVIGNEW